jgi:MFS family permease
LEDSPLKRKFAILLVVSGLAGLAFEIYELTFSLYLKDLGVPGRQMGLIYAVAGLATVLLRIYLGHVSDHWGRRGIYAGSLGVLGGAILFTPAVTASLGLNIVKTLRDGANYVRMAMHSLYLFDAEKSGFKRLIANTRGFEVIMQGVGALVGGWLLVRIDTYTAPMTVAGLAVLAGGGLLLALPKDTPKVKRTQKLGARTLLALDMPPVLKLVTIRHFVFMIGLAASHCFIMQQWFVLKFGASEATVGIIMAIHRFSFGIPLVLAAMIPFKRLRLAAGLAIVLQGLTVTGAAFVPPPHIWLATAIWLTHDMFGAAVWNPIHSEWVQRYANQEVRGRQASQSETISNLGWVVGPLIAGECVQAGWIDGPFILAGVIMAVSALPIAWMPASADKEPVEPEDAAEALAMQSTGTTGSRGGGSS